MAPRHERLWQWFETLESGVRPRPRVEVWPRGGTKSTTAELGCTRLASKRTRRFLLYVSETQPQADKHVQSIGTMLERLGEPRAVNEYGASKGWRHQELRTASGFNAVSYGLDSAVRGVKLDELRPDVIVFDDVDSRHDTEAARQKKVEAITTSILPAGSPDCAVLFVQNLITEDSIMAQLCDGRADFLHDREVPVIEPAIRGLEVERIITEAGAGYRIIAGEPTWEGQGIATCEQQINAWGLSAFLREAQHQVDMADGGLWERGWIDEHRVTKAPELVRVMVGLDPSVAASGGDEAGIIVAGVDARGHAYILDDRSVQGSPRAWAEAAVAAFHTYHATKLVAESNQGGAMIETTIATIADAPVVTLIHASQGKQTRAEPVASLAEAGRVHHVGRFPELERELLTWQPGMASPNRLDALVHVLTALVLERPKPRMRLL